MWAAAAETILLFDAKLQWVKKKRLVLEREKIAVLSMILHNSKVWLGTNHGLVTVNPDDMTVMNYFPEKVRPFILLDFSLIYVNEIKFVLICLKSLI